MDQGHFQSRAAAAMLELMGESRGLMPSAADLAERLGVSRAVLQDHCPDLDALVIALAQDALVTMGDSCVRAMVQADPSRPLEQVQALGRGYLQWVLDNPAHYRLLYDERTQRLATDPELIRQSTGIQRLIRNFMARAKEMGHLRNDTDVNLASVMAYSYAYGLARVAMMGPVTDYALRGEGGAGDPHAILFAALDEGVRELAIGAPNEAAAFADPSRPPDQPSRSEA